MKTIKQIADETGKSKTAIMKKIDNLGLRSGLRKIDNQFAIDEQQESLILQAFLEKSQTKSQTKTANQSQTGLQLSLRFLEQEIESLRSQLKLKDEQYDKLYKLFEHEQELRLAELQNRQDVLLAGKTDSNKLVGFFARFFGRKKLVK